MRKRNNSLFRSGGQFGNVAQIRYLREENARLQGDKQLPSQYNSTTGRISFDCPFCGHRIITMQVGAVDTTSCESCIWDFKRAMNDGCAGDFIHWVNGGIAYVYTFIPEKHQNILDRQLIPPGYFE